MKKRTTKQMLTLAACTILLSLSGYAHAAPLSGVPYQFSQPNGTETYEGYLYGDEYFSYLCDDEGCLLTQDTDGYYVYAKLVENRLTPTSLRYGEAISSGTAGGGSSGGVLFSSQADLTDEVFATGYDGSLMRQAEQNAPQPLLLTAESGSFDQFELNNVVIFTEFKNQSFSSTSKNLYEGLFNTNEDSLKNYYEEASYGKLRMHSVLPTQNGSIDPCRISDALSHYIKPTSGTWSWEDRENELVKKAVTKASSKFSQDLDLDRDNDGYIDMLTIVLAGSTRGGGDQIFWPHQTFYTGEEITINGKKVGNYNIQIENTLRGTASSDGSETFQKGSDILIHESLHMLGLPDLYYYRFFNAKGGNSTVSMGEWDIMSAGQGVHMCSYLKQNYCNWIDIPEIKESGTYTLKEMRLDENCAYMVRSPRNANEYFILEFRRKTGAFEKNIPLNNALVVYRVLADHRLSGNADASSKNGTDDEIRVLYAASSGAMYPKFSDGISSGISITNFSTSGNTATFTLTLPEEKNLFYFTDPNLAARICKQLGKTAPEVTEADLLNLETLQLSHSAFQAPYDLRGLEHLTGLRTLIANSGSIDDIGMLSSLVNLEHLELENNAITDISALSALTKLRTLLLRGNRIDDYTPTASYYDTLTKKDFSLSDTGDALFLMPNYSTENLGKLYLTQSSVTPFRIYYALEKYDQNTNELIKRYRGSFSPYGTVQKSLTPPTDFFADNTSYLKLITYENNQYRHIMDEVLVGSTEFHFN